MIKVDENGNPTHHEGKTVLQVIKEEKRREDARDVMMEVREGLVGSRHFPEREDLWRR